MVELYEKLGFEVVGQNDRGTTLAYGDTKLFLFEARTREDVQQRELGLLSNHPGSTTSPFLATMSTRCIGASWQRGPRPEVRRPTRTGARAFGCGTCTA